MSRWATFDCYGTLIDWNTGIGGVLEQLYGAEQAPTLLRRYHELEPEIQGEDYRTYNEVLALTLEQLANEVGYGIPEGEGRRARAVAAGLAALSRGAEGAGRAAPAGLEPGDPLEHRPRADRSNRRSGSASRST